MKPTGRYCFCLFHWPDPTPKRNHQIAISRAKIKSRQSQTCVKYRGNIICIKRNTDVNTSDLKILHKKRPNKVDLPDQSISKYISKMQEIKTLHCSSVSWSLGVRDHLRVTSLIVIYCYASYFQYFTYI